MLSDAGIQRQMADAMRRDTRIITKAERKSRAIAGDLAFQVAASAAEINRGTAAEDLRLLSPETLSKRLSVFENAFTNLEKQFNSLVSKVNEQPSTDATPMILEGTGYNSVRYSPMGKPTIWGRYRGPFSCLLSTKNGAGVTATNTITLEMKGGYVTAGRTSFWHPFNNVSDTEVLITVPPRTHGNKTWVYMEVPVVPHSDTVTCEKLWPANTVDGGTLITPNSMTLNTDDAQYYPCVRSSGTYPSQLAQEYIAATPDVQYDNGLNVVRHSVFGPSILPVANIIIGYVTWDSITDIASWTQVWEGGDIYVPVWRWRHCANDDGFPNNTGSDAMPQVGVYPAPSAASIHCVFGASFCSPICIVPWDLFDVHKHGGGAVPDDIGAGECG